MVLLTLAVAILRGEWQKRFVKVQMQEIVKKMNSLVEEVQKNEA